MTSRVDQAIAFATLAHEGQERKYTGEPYITHPIAVAEIVSQVPHTTEMLMAAILHDTVEDTPVTFADIEREFGRDVRVLVFWLTEVSKPEDGNRATRKAMDLAHYAAAPAEAQTVKIADMIHNTMSIKEHDPDFWVIYQKEKLAILDALVLADPTLRERARRLVTE
jgi:(p)ppGpp synthase/HD superfamily hydrolase